MHGLLPPASPKVEVADLPWVLSLGYECYGPYDPGGVLRFLLGAVNSPDILAIRSEDKNAALCASIVIPPWYPKAPECNVLLICARKGSHWQAVKLLRESISWARLRGCVVWRFHSDSKHGVGALALRVGAREDTTRYVMDLNP